ncbi:MAG: hypothetical protein V1921_07465 [Candidatus Altiarchaeota archaeon]
MVSKIHIIGTGAIILMAFIAVIVILVLWIYFGYHYEVITPPQIALQEVTSTLAV